MEELQVEFQSKYGTEVGTVARPYAFVKFGKYYCSNEFKLRNVLMIDLICFIFINKNKKQKFVIFTWTE